MNYRAGLAAGDYVRLTVRVQPDVLILVERQKIRKGPLVTPESPGCECASGPTTTG